MFQLALLVWALLPVPEMESARKALAARDYAAASEQFRAALARAESGEGGQAAVLEALRGCATAARLDGRFEEAEKFLTRAVAAATPPASVEPGLELASVLSELGAVQRSRGERHAALISLRGAIQILEDRGDGRPEDLARYLTAQAMLETALEDTAGARATLERALAAWDRAVAPDSPELLPVLDALGGSCRDSAEYERAEVLYRRALALREAALGPDSPEILSTLDSLAYVSFGQKKFAEAEPIYKRLLALWQSSAGPDHPLVALTLDKMTEFYAFQQRYEEAEQAASAALALRAGAHIASLHQTGRVLLMEAKLSDADDLYGRAIRIGDLAKASDETLDPLLPVYAGILRELKRADEADAIDKRVKDAVLRKADREGRRPAPVPAR